ncbi:uncharacterized protein G2W53_014058 [Senna tora]|uniref:Uncharacterized protein n=1 Tax=Senna tora TaxID=362788 RepID=A0A834WPY8_9FABA|nr:uncharacterized protein G2W53_014058 [Senna tora]
MTERPRGCDLDWAKVKNAKNKGDIT